MAPTSKTGAPPLWFLVFLAAFFSIPDAQALGANEDPSLTLGEALQSALDGNLELKAASFHIRSADAYQKYAGRSPNPILGIQLEDFLGSGPISGFSGAETTVRLTQKIELGKKSRARVRVANAHRSVAQAESQRLRIHVLATTVIGFVHVLADQHRLVIAREAYKVSAQGLEVAKRRIRGGAASAVEEHRASIALARRRIQREHAEHELLASKRRLAMMFGHTEPRFERVEGNLFKLGAVPNYEELATQIERNPELAQLAKAQAVQSAKLALAESKAVPDLTLSLGGRRFENPGAFGFVFGVSVPLPFFQRNRSAIGSAKMESKELSAKQEGTRLRILSGLYGHVQELKHAQDVLSSLDTNMLPDAQQVFRLITQGFKIGRFSQIEMLDAQKTLIELKRERVDVAEEVWAITVRIRSVLGAREVAPKADSETPKTTPPPSQGVRHE